MSTEPNFLYIVDPVNYTGNIVNTMPFVEKRSRNGMDILNTTYVHYNKGVTFEDYNKKHGGQLLALTWDEYNSQFYAPHLKKLCGEFTPSTEAHFWDALECVPPKRWTRYSKSEYFFLGECYNANIYRCFVRKGKDYFTALRPITTKEEDILNLV